MIPRARYFAASVIVCCILALAAWKAPIVTAALLFGVIGLGVIYAIALIFEIARHPDTWWQDKEGAA